MYARIEDNVVMEWPLFEGDLAERFPDMSFPLDRYNLPVPEGYVRIHPSPPLVQEIGFKYVQSSPKKASDGLWYQHFDRVPLSDEEKDAQRTFFESEVRNQRNKLLASSDIFVLVDNWAKLDKEAADNIVEYRQLLRDISTQPGFPYDIVWPSNPVE